MFFTQGVNGVLRGVVIVTVIIWIGFRAASFSKKEATIFAGVVLFTGLTILLLQHQIQAIYCLNHAIHVKTAMSSRFQDKAVTNHQDHRRITQQPDPNKAIGRY